MDPQAIQQGLATAIIGAEITGIMQSLPSLPDALHPPTFAVVEYETDYNQTFGVGSGALTEAVFSAGIFTSRGDTPTGQALLAQYLAVDGPTSIKTAVEADRTLGGACKTLIVERARGAGRLYDIAGTYYLGATFDVRVWA